jgi:hypothetical protein
MNLFNTAGLQLAGRVVTTAPTWSPSEPERLRTKTQPGRAYTSEHGSADIELWSMAQPTDETERRKQIEARECLMEEEEEDYILWQYQYN